MNFCAALFIATLWFGDSLFGLAHGYFAIRLQVDFVADDGQGDAVAQHAAQFLHPVLHLGERVLVGDVIDEDGGV